MQCVGTAEDIWWPILRMGVQERADSSQCIFHALESQRWAIVFVILATHRQTESVTRRDNDARRPDFHVEINRLTRLERPSFIVGVIWAVWQRSCWIELAMGCTQPAQGDRRSRIV